MRLLINPIKFSLTRTEKKHFEILRKLADCLGSRPLGKVEVIRQPATALRFSMLFKVLLDESTNKSLETKISELYGEASDLQGFVSFYRDLAIQYFFMVKFHQHMEDREKAIYYVNKSLSLAKVIGDYSGTRWAKYLKIFLLISNFILPIQLMFCRNKSKL